MLQSLKRQKYYVEFIATRRDSTEVFDTSKETFNFVLEFVKFLVITPMFTSVALWRNNRFQTDVAGRWARFVAFVRGIH